MTIHDVLVRPLVTEKGITKKEEERTLCFEVAQDANKIHGEAGGREALQGEGGRSSHGELSTANCGAADVSPATARTGRKHT